MPSAFVLLNVESGSEDSVLAQLREIADVKEAYVSYGVYDLIVKIKTNDMDELKEEVSHKIRSIDKVRKTFTLVTVEE